MTIAFIGATFFLLGLILGGIVTLLYTSSRHASVSTAGFIPCRLDVANANVPPCKLGVSHG